MAVGHSPSAVQSKRRIMKLCGMVNGVQTQILVDLGSVGSFVSQQLAQHVSQEPTVCEPT
jgi:hypothetical protein